MSVRESNFRDPETGEEFFHSQYRTIISDIDASCTYKDQYGQIIVNPKTGTPLVPIQIEGPITVPMFAKFNPNSIEGQKNIKAHFGKTAHKDNTQGAGRDEKDQRVNDFKKELGVRKKKVNLPI